MVRGGRPGAGRPTGTGGKQPPVLIRIVASDEEKAEILAKTTPRERAEALLRLARGERIPMESNEEWLAGLATGDTVVVLSPHHPPETQTVTRALKTRVEVSDGLVYSRKTGRALRASGLRPPRIVPSP
jgi:hypothetical protein